MTDEPNKRPVLVVIPTIGYSHMLIPLINELERDSGVGKIMLTVNLECQVDRIKESFRFGEPNIDVVETWPLGNSIYHGWNVAIERARKEDAWLAVLNDDIHLPKPNAISDVVRLLDADPSYAIVGLNWQGESGGAGPLRPVSGSYRHHGVGGFAWVCDPHKVETVPDDLVHWGGDDFIFFRAHDAGYKLGIANHVHVEHPAPETTSVSQPWTYEARIKDREVFESYYPRRGW